MIPKMIIIKGKLGMRNLQPKPKVMRNGNLENNDFESKTY